MITPPLIAALGAAVLSTSFISGIFGMAGGMILIGLLLLMMPLAAAMVLHGVTQTASNGWRAWLWREHIRWRVVAWYSVGAVVAVLGFALIQATPSKPVALITLGLLSLVGLTLPAQIAPDVARPRHAVLCGTVCVALQFVAGVSGPIFDVFFVRSAGGRREIIATKAAIQTLGHSLKAAYFAQLLTGDGQMITPLAAMLAVSFAVIGTQLSRTVLDAISDAHFRQWTRALIAVIATVYLVHGAVLLALGPQPV
jgi:uncharacterized membrane protein YfcA